MSSESNLPLSRTLLASVTAGLTGTLVYYVLRQRFLNNREEYKDPRTSILHVEIPRETVGHLIGRDGFNIKQTEEKTSTSITFLDEGGPCRIVVVRGSKDGVEMAKLEILKSVDEYAHLETLEIYISKEVAFKLSADESQKMKDIAKISNARIYLEELQEKPSLLVRGTYNQIEKVKDCLKKMVADDIPPVPKTNSPQKASPIANVNERSQLGSVDYEKLEPTSSDGYCEIMVSYVDTPSKFFVQKCGILSKELDSLIKNMTDYYSNRDNSFPSLKLEVGDLVACFISDDNCWYRATIVSADLNAETVTNEDFFSVKLVDFGDTIVTDKHCLASLLPEFLNMRFQAIECTLHGIEPTSGNSSWTEGTVEVFENLTYCTQWKILMARIESHVQLDGRLIPSVKLVDTNSTKDIDIASELIVMGHATSKIL